MPSPQQARVGQLVSHLGGMATTPAATSTASIPVIDTHQHMFYLSEWSCPWLEGLTINKDFTMEDYDFAMSGSNVVKTIFMETAAATCVHRRLHCRVHRTAPLRSS